MIQSIHAKKKLTEYCNVTLTTRRDMSVRVFQKAAFVLFSWLKIYTNEHLKNQFVECWRTSADSANFGECLVELHM